jgi:hypothetical protein
MRIVIGADEIQGEPEVVIMAIGSRQPIGVTVGRSKRTGRFVTAVKRMIVGAYSTVEHILLERRPTPRVAPAKLARAVVVLALIVVTSPAPMASAAAAILALAVPTLRGFMRAAVGYLDREFAQQWRLALATVIPAGLFLAWAASRR